jgi:hypothetical protein
MARNEIYNLNWCGTLTTQNMDAVCGLLLRLLDGKKFTVVTVENEINTRHYPEIETKQVLSPDPSNGKKISSWISNDHSNAGIQISGNFDIVFFTHFLYSVPSVNFYGDHVIITYNDPYGNTFYRAYIPEG